MVGDKRGRVALLIFFIDFLLALQIRIGSHTYWFELNAGAQEKQHADGEECDNVGHK